MSEQAPAWNQTYYDLLEFYLFEPQHIAPKPRVDATKRRTVPEAIKRLKRLETPFNHVFSLFFRLAPPEFIGTIVSAAFADGSPSHDLASIGREADRKFDLRNTTQPDLLFVGSDAIVCIEMKIDAKTDAEQIFKYAALFAHIDPAAKKRRFLIYMGPKDFARLWRRNGVTLEIAKEMAIEFARDLPTKLSGAALVKKIPDVVAVVASLRLGYLSYSDVRQILEREAARAMAPDGVYRRLLGGMAAEISGRGY